MTVLQALFAHYRRHPVQGLFLLVGIVVANVLLAGTLLINAQARASYGQGAQLLNAAPAGQIRPRESGRMIDEADYVRLRLAGYHTVAPLLRQVVLTETKKPIEMLGIDVFAMPRGSSSGTPAPRNELDFTGFAYPPYRIWVSPARLSQLDAEEGERLPLLAGGELPPLIALSGRQLGHRMLIDIGALQELTQLRGRLSSLLVFPDSADRIAQLRVVLPDHLEFIPSSDAPDPAELTRSFHLNLAAMGLLAFVVGVFLTYNALAFSYTDRAELIRKLRLAGVARAEMRNALLLELALFLVLGLLLGGWLGAWLAAALLPGVGQTLAQLYGVYIAYPDSLVPTGFWLPPLMTAAAALLCVLFPLREALAAPMLERRQSAWRQRNVEWRDRWFAVTGCVLLLTAFALARSSTGLWPSLVGMACLLLGAALLLPLVLRVLLSALDRLVPARSARLSWLVADSRWLMGPASLALMAMTLALVANSGLNTMISSFRDATEQWLDQRLVADLYLRSDLTPESVLEGLAGEAIGLEAGERYRTTAVRSTPRGRSAELEIVSLRSGARFRNAVRLIDSATEAAERFRAGEGIFVSERAWRLDGWATGDRVRLCADAPELPVLGTYHDYGNPRSQWMVSRGLYLQCWPGQSPSGLTLSGPESTDWNRVRAQLTERLGFEDDEIIEPREVKASAMAIFDRTFVVTRALNALTLIVAGIGIFCAISAIHHHRAGLQAHLASLGLSRRERGAMLALQWGLLGLLCMVLVWPFGTLLAAYLASVVTPAAFGWSFPLRVEGAHYLELTVIAVTSLLLAVTLPSVRLLRVSAATLLREETL
jgi:putative ABC transport system permease protein